MEPTTLGPASALAEAPTAVPGPTPDPPATAETALDKTESPASAPHQALVFGTPEFDAAVHEAGKLSDWVDRELRFREILSDVPLGQLSAIYSAAQKLHSPESDALLSALGERWAKLDPRGAIAFGLARRKADGGYSFLSSIEEKWAAVAPSDAIDFARTLPPSYQRTQFMQEIVRIISDLDPQRAVQLLRENPQYSQWAATSLFDKWTARDPQAAAAAALELKGNLGTRATGGVAETWGQSDPAAAIAWAAAIPSAARRKGLIGSIAEVWAKSDPEAVLAWAQDQTDPKVRRDAINAGLGSLAATNLPAALQRINAMPAGEDRDRAIQATANTESSKDTRSALQLAELLPTGLARDGTVSQICSTWGQKEPRAALDWLVANAPAALGGGGGLQEIVRGWAGTAPDQAIAWAQALPPSDSQNSAMAALIGGLAVSDLGRAETIFQQSSPDAQKLAVPQITRNLINQGPEKARAWVESLAAGPAQNDAYGYVAAAWSDQNPNAVATWLGTLSPGKARDAAISGFAMKAVERDPEGAATWTQTISDPRDRDTQTEAVMQRWLGTDSNAARSWLDANPQISPEEKARILPN